MTEARLCAICGATLPPQGRGRPRLVCSDKCKAQAYRARLRLETEQADKSLVKPMPVADALAEWRRQFSLIDQALADCPPDKTAGLFAQRARALDAIERLSKVEAPPVDWVASIVADGNG